MKQAKTAEGALNGAPTPSRKRATKKTPETKKQETEQTVKAPETADPPSIKPPAPRSVAIVAMGTSRNDYLLNAVNRHSRYGVADEIWAINAMAGIIQWDKAFIIDPHDEMPPEYINTYRDAGTKPVFTCKTHPAFPGLIEYPLAEVVNFLGGLPYLNTSVAYALAYALYLGVKDIWLFGCDFCYPDAYKAESGRGCVEAWIMFGMMKGHRIHIAKTSTLFDTSIGMPLYGFENKYSVEKTPDGQVHLVKKEPKDELGKGQT